VPGIQPGVPLDVKYGSRNSGLRWDFVLDMEISEQNILDCALLVVIRTEKELPDTTKSILSKRPEIILASAQNKLLDDALSVHNVGRPVIEANSRILFKIEEGRTPYKIVYHWDASRRERPTGNLRAATPSKTCPLPTRSNTAWKTGSANPSPSKSPCPSATAGSTATNTILPKPRTNAPATG
jgi:hypothetical protein